jgi:hypothetical protein
MLPTFEERREVLRAATLPRHPRTWYRAVHEGRDITGAMPWGQAMACAQKSLRNGAAIAPDTGGAFTLTDESTGRAVRFEPATI